MTLTITYDTMGNMDEHYQVVNAWLSELLQRAVYVYVVKKEVIIRKK